MDALKSEDIKSRRGEIIEILEEDPTGKHEQNVADTSSPKLVPVHRGSYRRSMYKEKIYRRMHKIYNGRTKAVVILNAVRKSDFSYVKNWPSLHFDWKCRDGIVSKPRFKRHQYLIVSPTNKSCPKSDHKYRKDEPQKRIIVGGYSCLLCDISFDVLADLKKHTVSHGQLRNCANSTVEAVKFDQQKIQHNYVRKIEAFECIICLKFYKSLKETEEHIICEHIELRLQPQAAESTTNNQDKHAEHSDELENCLDIDQASTDVYQDCDAPKNLGGGIVAKAGGNCEFEKSTHVGSEDCSDVCGGEKGDVIARGEGNTATEACYLSSDIDLSEGETYDRNKRSEAVVQTEQNGGVTTQLYMAENDNSSNRMAVEQEGENEDSRECLHAAENSHCLLRNLLESKIESTSYCQFRAKSFKNSMGMLGLVQEQTEKNHSPKLKKFKCDVCKKSFSSKSTMARHIKQLHAVEKPQELKKFNCRFCKKSFEVRDHLSYHVKSLHTKPVCSPCKQDFETCEKLQDHVKTDGCEPLHCNTDVDDQNGSIEECRPQKDGDKGLHGTEKKITHKLKKLTCRFCTNSFKTRENLSRHIKSLHKKPVCITCKEDLETFENLRDHIKSGKCERICFTANVNEQDDSVKKTGRSGNIDNDEKDDSSTETLKEPSVSVSQQKSPPGEFPTCFSNERTASPRLKQDKFHCRFCNTSFQKLYKMYRHIRESHIEKKTKSEKPKMFQCRFCSLSTKTEGSLCYHFKSRHKEPVCVFCNQRFETFDRLHEHCKAENCDKGPSSSTFVDGTGKNSDCSGIVQNALGGKGDSSRLDAVNVLPDAPEETNKRKFSTKNVHEEEVKKKAQFGIFKCKFCRSSFKRFGGRYYHAQKYHKKPLCVTCKQDFETFDKLQDHIKAEHCDETVDYRCRFCFKPFKKYGHFFKHVTILHNEPFCVFCNQKFGAFDKLHEHVMALHSDKQFSTKDVPREEVKKVFKCKFCRSSYKSFDSRYHHIQKYHKKPLCVMCNQDLETFDKLQNHIKAEHCDETSESRCRFCFKLFKQHGTFFKHLAIVHKEPFCTFCNQKFDAFDKLHEHATAVHSDKQARFNTTVGERSNTTVGDRNTCFEMSSVEVYSCSLCGQSEPSLLSIQSHIEECKKGVSETFACAKWKNMFLCPKCQMPFRRHFNVQRHMQEHNQKKSLTCKICLFSCDGEHKMLDHCYQHCNRVPITCSSCQQEFKNMYEFKERHNSRCDNSSPLLRNEIPYRCTECNLTISNDKQDYTKHFRSNHLEQRKVRNAVICDVCGKNLNGLSCLRQHKQRLHTSIENWVECDLCFRKFPHEEILRQHKSINHDGQNYTCDICGKVLKTKFCFKIHMQEVHSENQNVKCKICCKTFRTAKRAKEHEKFVHGKKKFKTFSCSECSKSLKSNEGLKNHMLYAHTTERKYKCSTCVKSFKTRTALDGHRKLHLNQRKFECDVCQEQFKLKHHLKAHMLKHTGERAFKCYKCDKSFSRKQILETHMLTHTGEKAFVCEHCDKSFFRKTDLNKHTRLCHTDDGLT